MGGLPPLSSVEGLLSRSAMYWSLSLTTCMRTASRHQSAAFHQVLEGPLSLSRPAISAHLSSLRYASHPLQWALRKVWLPAILTICHDCRHCLQLRMSSCHAPSRGQCFCFPGELSPASKLLALRSALPPASIPCTVQGMYRLWQHHIWKRPTA